MPNAGLTTTENLRASPFSQVFKGQISQQRADCFHKYVSISNLKTAISGTYHAFDFEKYVHRYLGEYQYRFNRRFDLAGMMSRLIHAAAQTGKRSEGWLRLAEDQC